MIPRLKCLKSQFLDNVTIYCKENWSDIDNIKRMLVLHMFIIITRLQMPDANKRLNWKKKRHACLR